MGGKTSATSKNKYNSKTYDRIAVMFPKLEGEKIRQIAASSGESVGGYIKKAVQMRIEKEGKL